VGAFWFQASGEEFRGRRGGAVRGVHAERDVPGLRELGREPGQPAVPGARVWPRAEQQEVPPVEAGVAGGADDQVIAAVGGLGALEDPQRHVGPEAERRYPHVARA
jgi:hypothetical protein